MGDWSMCPQLLELNSVRRYIVTTLCYKKPSLKMFDNNFGKCKPIFKILSPDDSSVNSLCTRHKDFHLTYNMLLHYLVKVKNPNILLTLTAPQQTVEMFLRTL